jgi:hypothetical protein
MAKDQSEQIKANLVAAVQGAADVLIASRKAVKDLVVGGIKDVGEVAANAAITAGSVKSAVIGVAEAGKETMEGVRGAAAGVIQAASELGTDLRAAASSTMKGILEAAAELGQDAGRMGRAGAEAMIDAAGDLGEKAVDSVRRGMLEAASVPREVVEAATAEPPSGSDEKPPPA